MSSAKRSPVEWMRGRRGAAHRTSIDHSAMTRSNDDFRLEVLRAVPSTDGIPNYLLRTVWMLRAAFPTGVAIDSQDYTALWLFLEQEGCSPSAIATSLDFAFDLGYLEARNALGQVRTAEERDREIARTEE